MDPDSAAIADVNGDGKADLLLSYAHANSLSRSNAGAVLVWLQPAAGWSSVLTAGPPSTLRYATYHWDGSDGFQIYGPQANTLCDYSTEPPYVADVRPGDNAPEIIISCEHIGENAWGSIYGLYRNKGWPMARDLNDLN